MHAFRTVLLLSAAASAAVTASAQQVLRAVNGDQPGSNFGRSLAPIGDVDGDGTVDLVIGEPGRDSGGATDAGAAVLFRTGAWAIRTRSFSVQPLTRLGTSVAGLGDVDGDQIPDFACGAPTATANSGLVRIVSGASGLTLREIQGELLSQFGTAICSIGDRNGDVRADFAVSSPINSLQTPSGAVRFYSGSNGALLATIPVGNNTGFGKGLATLGDLNGDGQPEIAIGEPGADDNGVDSGRVYVKNPRDGLANSWFWTNSVAFAAGSEAGQVVGSAGDVNGDGLDDVIATTDNGSVRVLSGANGVQLLTFNNPEFGSHPAAIDIGDWNGDGIRDLAIGAPTANLTQGSVFVYSTGPGRGLLARIDGPALSGFGASLAALGDLNGDGRTEFAVGAPTYANASNQVVGRVSVHTWNIDPIAQPFGTGCPGSNGTPSLYFAGNANVGENLDVLCGNLRINSFGFWLFGFSNSNLGTTPLPASLTPFGYSGCTLYVSSEALEPFATTNTTLATRRIVIPNIPAFARLRFYVQASQLDALAAGGIAFSNAGEIGIGNL
jgi:hypothetical protein